MFASSPLARADTIPFERAYTDIKNAEHDLPVPAPLQTINVGAFDAATGRRVGALGEAEVVASVAIQGRRAFSSAVVYHRYLSPVSLL
jgi:hypothetical protein